MSHKRKGELTVSDEWAKHLRPFNKRKQAKQERRAAKEFARRETELARKDS